MADIVFHHVAIACQDPIKVEKWYTNHFGFTRARVLPVGEGEQIVFIKNGPAYMEIFQAKAEQPYPEHEKDGPWWTEWRHIAFKVDDVEAKLKEMGDDVTVTLGPLDFSDFIPNWKTVWVSDPEGNIVEISQGFVDEDNPPALR